MALAARSRWGSCRKRSWSRLIDMASDAGSPAKAHFPGSLLRAQGRTDVCPWTRGVEKR